jgi:hypothetical protein
MLRRIQYRFSLPFVVLSAKSGWYRSIHEFASSWLKLPLLQFGDEFVCMQAEIALRVLLYGRNKAARISG